MIKNIFLIIFFCIAQCAQAGFSYIPETVRIPETKAQERYNNRLTEKNSPYKTTNQFYTKDTIEPKHIVEEIKLQETNKENIEKQLLTRTEPIKNENEISALQKVTLKDNRVEKNKSQATIIQQVDQKPQEKNIQQLFTPLTGQPSSINLKSLMEGPSAFYDKVSDKFNQQITKMTFSLLKKSMNISHHVKISQLNFTDIITESLKKYLFLFFQLPNNFDTTTQVGTAVNNFKMEIQFLVQKINSYNNKKYYTNPDEMLTLIKLINRFLKEVNAQKRSISITKKFDTINTQATICCNIFTNQNIIFSTENTPKQIMSFFQKPIRNINNLPHLQYEYNLIEIIYNDYGYIDQILQTWQAYQTSDFYKNKVNREYGAFITFLLIFDNSIIAADHVLDQISALYKITKPAQATINIDEV